ncbi:MAG: hypothetical protein ACOVOW_07440 [Spirosomataceae bacterium]|jgi:hypothetical protein
MASKKDLFKKRAVEVATIHNTPKPAPLGGGFNDIERIKNNIVILDELRDLIRPLSPEQFGQLEQNLLAHGCQDALILWETSTTELQQDDLDTIVYVLVDGHNRFAICQKNKIEFKINLKIFESLEKVKEFMIDLQLGRRNITPEEESYLRGLKYNTQKTTRGSILQVQDEQEKPVNVAEKLAEEFNVSVRTIKNDGKFAQGLTKLSKELQEQVLSGNKAISKKQIQLLADRSDIAPEAINDLSALVTKSDSEASGVQTSQLPSVSKVLKNSIINLANQLTSESDCDVLIQKIQEFKLSL